MSVALEKRSESVCFGGRLGVYGHDSQQTGTPMAFSVYLPPAAEHGPCPAVYFLAGLTCTQDTFVQKAGAQRVAAELGLILIAPDTSPRGAGIAGEDTDWDFGTGAGFYLDATQEPWSKNYRMGSYVNEELPALVAANFPVQPGKQGIMGHSMGGHGALVSALRHPGKWQSVSALSPICHPVDVPWGKKAFGNYLGADEAAWQDYDAAVLMRRARLSGSGAGGPGHRGPVPGDAVAAGGAGGGGRGFGPGAEAAAADGLRPFLLVHPDGDRGSPAASCGGA